MRENSKVERRSKSFCNQAGQTLLPSEINVARRKVCAGVWNGIPTEMIKRRTSDINASSDVEICPRFPLISSSLDSANIKTLFLILFCNGPVILSLEGVCGRRSKVRRD